MQAPARVAQKTFHQPTNQPYKNELTFDSYVLMSPGRGGGGGGSRPASQCIPHTSPEAAQTGLPGSCLVPLHQKPEGKEVPRVMGY